MIRVFGKKRVDTLHGYTIKKRIWIYSMAFILNAKEFDNLNDQISFGNKRLNYEKLRFV